MPLLPSTCLTCSEVVTTGDTVGQAFRSSWLGTCQKENKRDEGCIALAARPIFCRSLGMATLALGSGGARPTFHFLTSREAGATSSEVEALR